VKRASTSNSQGTPQRTEPSQSGEHARGKLQSLHLRQREKFRSLDKGMAMDCFVF
jgi:hypothetical protein